MNTRTATPEPVAVTDEMIGAGALVHSKFLGLPRAANRDIDRALYGEIYLAMQAARNPEPVTPVTEMGIDMSSIEVRDPVWQAILGDERLKRARRHLSFHELRLIINHVRTGLDEQLHTAGMIRTSEGIGMASKIGGNS